MQSLHPPGKDVILYTGNYGSGKTEVSVNVVSALAKAGEKVVIADLDLVNPYFRCREVSEQLEEQGIRVVAPNSSLKNADLPILMPEVQGAIERPAGVTILDVGGDNVGTTVLSSLKTVFQRIPYEMIFVLNKNRPFTDTVKGALQLIDEIEHASRLKISALVGNTHMMEETDLPMVIEGAEFTVEVSKARKIPISFITVPVNVLYAEGFLDHPDPEVGCLMELKDFPAPILPLKRIMLPPWLTGPTLGTVATHARDRFGKLSK